jgi:hypothetical protein
VNFVHVHCQTKVLLQEAESFLLAGVLRKLNAVHALSNFVRVNEPLDLFWISSGFLDVAIINFCLWTIIVVGIL